MPNSPNLGVDYFGAFLLHTLLDAKESSGYTSSRLRTVTKGKNPMTNKKLSLVLSILIGGLLAIMVALVAPVADSTSYPYVRLVGTTLLGLIYSGVIWICLFADHIKVIRTRRYLTSAVKSIAIGSLLTLGGIGGLALIEYRFNDTRLTFSLAGIILVIIIFSGAPLHGIFNPKKKLS